MSGEARGVRDFGIERLLAAATVDAYQVAQMPTGKAGYYDSGTPASSGSYVEFATKGTVTMPKTTGFVGLKGGRAYWDYSANKVYYKPINDRDFYVGRFSEDATSAADNCQIILNEAPSCDLDLARDPFISAITGTAAAGGFGYPVSLGGATILELTATNEVQKVDTLSVLGFHKNANAIVELAFRVLADGAASAADFNIGVANATHATDADSITEHVFVHLDENNTNINIQSKDTSTTVAATDTTSDYTEGSDHAKRVEVWFDLRDPADVQVYVNGSNVLPSSVFNIDAAVGPLYLLAHLEKTVSTDAYKVAVDWLRARLAEQ